MSDEDEGGSPQPDESEPDIVKQYITGLVESLQPSYDIENIDYEEIAEFFHRKGAIELISLLDSDGHRFDEIDDLLDISRGYLNDRRDEALSLGLVEPDQEVRGDSVRRIWVLTELGSDFKEKLEQLSIIKHHKRLIERRKEYNKMKDEFLQWAEDPDDLEEFILLLNKPNTEEIAMSNMAKFLEDFPQKDKDDLSEEDFDQLFGG
jgi:DNA-binding HxlR family transcriptional regulator